MKLLGSSKVFERNMAVSSGLTAFVHGRVVGWVFIVSLCGACSSGEERKTDYLNRAQASFAAQDFDKARIDVRNALQIDGEFIEARFLYAQLLERDQNWQQMVANLRAVLELDEHHVQARVKYGTVLLGSRQFDDAETQAGLVLESDPEFAEGYSLQSAIALQRGDVSYAVVLAQKALAKDPANVSAIAVLTEVHKSENPSLALETIAQGIELQSSESAFKLMRISVFEANDDIDAAMNEYRELIAENPENIYLHSRFVKLLQANGRHDDAVAVIRSAAKFRPEETQLKLWSVRYLAAQNRLDEAVAGLNSYIGQFPDDEDLKIELGPLLMAQQKHEEARAHYLQLIEVDEESELAQRSRYALALIEDRLGNPAKANLWIAELLEVEPESPDGLSFQANRALGSRRYDEAVTLGRAALRNRPDSGPVLGIIAEAHWSNQNFDLAKDTYQQILATDSLNEPALVRLADIALRQEEFGFAQEYVATALRINPANAEASRLLVSMYTQQGDLPQALREAQELVDKPSSKLLGTYLLAAVHFSDNNYQLAEQYFAEAVALEPRAREALAGLVRSKLELGKRDDAYSFLQKFSADNPADAQAPLILASLFAADQKDGEAEALYRRVLELEPETTAAYQQLGALQVRAGRPDLALATFDEGIGQKADPVGLLVRKAQILEQRADYSGARDAYERVLEIDDASALARNNLAVLLNEHDGSEDSLRRALTLMRSYSRESNPALLDTLGWIYYKLGEFPQAVDHLKAAIENGGNDPLMFFHLGMAQASAGDAVQAREMLDRALASGSPFAGEQEAREKVASLK